MKGEKHLSEKKNVINSTGLKRSCYINPDLALHSLVGAREPSLKSLQAFSPFGNSDSLSPKGKILKSTCHLSFPFFKKM